MNSPEQKLQDTPNAYDCGDTVVIRKLWNERNVPACVRDFTVRWDRTKQRRAVRFYKVELSRRVACQRPGSFWDAGTIISVEPWELSRG